LVHFIGEMRSYNGKRKFKAGIMALQALNFMNKVAFEVKKKENTKEESEPSGETKALDKLVGKRKSLLTKIHENNTNHSEESEKVEEGETTEETTEESTNKDSNESEIPKEEQKEEEESNENLEGEGSQKSNEQTSSSTEEQQPQP